MEGLLFCLASTCMDLIIRYYTKDKESYFTNGAIDVARLGKTICHTLLEERSLNHNIDEFCISFAERLEGSSLLDGIEEERKEAIISKVTSDLKKYIKMDGKTIEMMLKDGDLMDVISRKTRDSVNLWTEKERGVYNNCLRFSVDSVVKFIKTMPEYSEEAIRVLYKRDSEAFERLGDQLQTIIDLLNSQKKTIEKYRDYETDYLRKINLRYKDVRLFGTGLVNRNLKRYEISTSYIELLCLNIKNGTYDAPVEISSIFEENNYIWLSGEAGGGKTTFVQWLAVNTANQATEHFGNLIPIVIPLRRINTFPISFQDEISTMMGRACPDGWIDYLFKNNKVLLLFDGVDELSQNQREDFYDFIEEIVSEWADNKISHNKLLITARPYIDVKLRLDYSKFRILRMNSKQIEKFVYYWHNTVVSNSDDEIDAEQTAKKLVDAINRTPAIREIARTPLLCAMICAVNYSNNGYMPSNRNELYDRCCQMLIDARDKERDIEAIDYTTANKLNYRKKELILEKIAIEMLIDESVEISKLKLISYLESFFKENTIVDKEIEEDPAILLDYFIHRTGVLIEPAVGRISFVHKTFLEFLSGKELAKSHRVSNIIKNAINPFWKEAIIMSFNQMDQKDSSKILRKFITLHDEEKCDEYVFMASLCMDNCIVVRDDISESIHETIKELIPPSEENVYELSSCSGYIIPFLSDTEEYSLDERHRCIRLLRDIIIDIEDFSKEMLEEAVIMIMSYFHEGSSFNDMCLIANTVYDVYDLLDEHYDIAKRISQVIKNQMIKDGELTISVDMLNLIGRVDLIDISLPTVDELTIVNIFNTSEFVFLEGLTDQIIKWLSGIKTLTINSSCFRTYDILDYTGKIEKLDLIINSVDDAILDYICRRECCRNVKNLHLLSGSIKYICGKDFEEFVSMTSMSLELLSDDMEFEIDEWGMWPHLREVSLSLPRVVYYDMENDIKRWKEIYPNIEFSVDSFGVDRFSYLFCEGYGNNAYSLLLPD